MRRVPLDFDAPLRKVWKGYLNPHTDAHRECPFCFGSGLNPATRQISDDFYDFAHTGRRWSDNVTQDEVDALVEHDRLREWRGPVERWVSVPRTAAEVNAANARDRSPFGDMSHDGINRWILIETRAKRLGVYGHCEACDGGTIWRSPEARAEYEAWAPTEPPTGEAWQMWETTSEGSPISPPMPTPEALARWLADNGASTFGRDTASYDQWLAMTTPGWAPSMVADASGLKSGVEFVGGGT